MQKGADGVGSMVGQIFGKAAQYTSELYSKMGRSSGSLGGDVEPAEGASGVFWRRLSDAPKPLGLPMWRGTIRQ